tara:strand:- start:479 stop:664 length:186 start_codon:yes stop_codon:yes gene_type:complete
MAVKHWNRGASAERYRQENEPTKEKKMTSELKKDVHRSTKKMKKTTSEQASKGGSVSIPVE